MQIYKKYFGNYRGTTLKLVWAFKTDAREQNTIEDTELDGGKRRGKGRRRECWMDGVHKSMKTKDNVKNM